MAEPATTTTAAGWAVAAGLLASFLAALGVTWVHVFWAAAGAFVGAGWAPPSGRLRAMLMFPVSTMLAAKAGIVGAAWMGPVGGLPVADMAQALGGLAGIVFHPMAAALVQIAPALARLRLGIQEPKQ